MLRAIGATIRLVSMVAGEEVGIVREGAGNRVLVAIIRRKTLKRMVIAMMRVRRGVSSAVDSIRRLCIPRRAILRIIRHLVVVLRGMRGLGGGVGCPRVWAAGLEEAIMGVESRGGRRRR